MITDKQLFSVLQAALWCTFCAVPTFLAAYFYQLHLTSGQVGVFLAVQTASGFAGQFFWSYCSDRWLGYRTTYIIATVWLIAGYFMLFQQLPFNLLLIFALITGFVQFSLPVILDTWILHVFAQNTANYGPIRAVGSLSFALFSFFYGSILGKLGFEVMPYFALGFGVITLCCALRMAELPIGATSGRTNSGIKMLLNNRSYCYLLLLAFLVGVCATPFMQIIPVKITNIGASVGQLGIAMFLSSIMQLPPMFYYGKLAKIGQKRLLLVSLGMTGISYLLYANTNSFGLLLVSQGINGLGFGIMLPTMRRAVFGLTNKATATSAQGLIDAMQLCMGGIVGNLMTGQLLQHYGLGITVNLYAVSVILALVTTVIIDQQQK
ncbi:MAG: MFS transporter [Culicoidibacterales bacterium]